ncbi:hypothetical protein GGI05_000071 [Coemansia sp. RSA 2603]|nr:hypothetical protein GGI05_000071 [Coemansia sp. RSA 2603]
MHDNIGLHRIGNPSSKNKAVSLHLYSPPYNMCKTFNEQTGVAAESSCSAERLTTELNAGNSSSSSSNRNEVATYLHTHSITTVAARCQQQQQQPASSITSFQLSI